MQDLTTKIVIIYIVVIFHIKTINKISLYFQKKYRPKFFHVQTFLLTVSNIANSNREKIKRKIEPVNIEFDPV